MRPCRALLVAVVPLILSALDAPPAFTQFLAQYDYEDLEFRGIGAEVARFWPASVEPTNGIGLRLDLGLIGPRVRIMPTARYWGSTLRAGEVNRLASQIILVCERQLGVSCPERLDLGEVRFSDLEFSLDGHFLFLGDRTFAPYFGLGLALHLLNGSGDFIDGTFVEDLLDSVAPGVAGLTGFNVRLASSLSVGVEARFMLASDVRYAGVGVGGVWKLPHPVAGTTELLRLPEF